MKTKKPKPRAAPVCFHCGAPATDIEWFEQEMHTANMDYKVVFKFEPVTNGKGVCLACSAALTLKACATLYHRLAHQPMPVSALKRPR